MNEMERASPGKGREKSSVARFAKGEVREETL